MTPRARAVAIAMIVIGVGLVVVGLTQVSVGYAEFGWFVAAPSPVSSRIWTMLGLVSGGTLLVGIGSGLLLGRRRG